MKSNTIIILILLTLSAFFIRLHNFQTSNLRSIDEVVYYKMAEQVQHGLKYYNTIPYGKELAATGRDLPEYFFQPVYKHPPVFTLLISFFLRLFGNSMLSAGMVSVLLGALMIPIIYLIGKIIYNNIVGLLSALFLWLDPVSIITSQKIWPDTAIAFFMLLSALFFIYGIKKDNDWFYILSGIASGLAVNTKYTGILITFAIFVFTLTYKRDLFKNSKFLISLFLPIILLLPWFFWNYRIYGISSIMHHEEFNKLIRIFSHNILGIIIFLVLASSITFLSLRKEKNPFSNNIDIHNNTKYSNNILLIFVQASIVFAFIFLLKKQILNSLHLFYFPSVSWQLGFFRGQPPSFYFGRLIEFFFLYCFSFIALLLFNPKEKTENAFIRISAVIILLFFIVWGNFQSRYILSCLPFFVLLGSDLIYRIYSGLNGLNIFIVRIALKYIFVLTIFFMLIKVCLLDYFLSFPNNFCYY